MLLILLALISLALPTFAQTQPFRPSAKDGKVRGVNIGGWLVLEPYIRPSLFEQFKPNKWSIPTAVDEWTFCEQLGAEEAARQLHSHYENWFIENDARLLAEAGISHIRLGIGYWAIIPNSSEPYITGQLPYLKKALIWAKKYGLKVMIDLHAAPGSQNGWNHSGHQGVVRWNTPENWNATLVVLRKLIEETYLQPGYAEVVNWLGVVNEPFLPVTIDELKFFYKAAYDMIRNDLNISSLALTFSDSFRSGAFKGYFGDTKMQNVAFEPHVYHLFDPGSLQQSLDRRIVQVCSGDKGNMASLELRFNDDFDAFAQK